MGVVVLDPLFDEGDAALMLALWHEFGDYGQYSNEGFDTGFAPEIPQRYDAAMNFIRTGGRFGRRENLGLAAARTNYFRETYAYGDEVALPGIEAFRDHDALMDAAVAVHGHTIVVPSIVYANILLPGQELAVHTDVPEFRGANRTIVPQWLLVVMHHSGLFESWRMHIATGIAYFGSAQGGGLAYYPDGADGPAMVLEPRHNTAAVLDTDSIFHGVDRVAGDDQALGAITAEVRLRHAGATWEVYDPATDAVAATYADDDLRYSVSWKAYCFADDHERELWSVHADDLSLSFILDTLEDDLRRRGLADTRPSDDATFGRLLIDSYIRFPEPQPS
jgi:hypothetical protein